MAGESGWTLKDPDEAPPSASLSPLAGQEPEQPLRKLRVALAEDNPGDVRLVSEALNNYGFDFEIAIHRDGEEMLHYVDRVASGELPCPDVVLLDLNLPRHDGHAVLEYLRAHEQLNEVPVIIVTSSNAVRDRDLTLRLGANRFFCKPSDYDSFMLLGEVIRQVVEKNRTN